MNIKSRLTRRGGISGIDQINVAECLMDVNKRADVGENTSYHNHTPNELKKLIAVCQNEELRTLYRAALMESNRH